MWQRLNSFVGQNSATQRNLDFAINSDCKLFANQCRRPLIFQTINSVRPNNLKCWRFTLSGCKDVRIRNFEIVEKAQLVWLIKIVKFPSFPYLNQSINHWRIWWLNICKIHLSWPKKPINLFKFFSLMKIFIKSKFCLVQFLELMGLLFGILALLFLIY